MRHDGLHLNLPATSHVCMIQEVVIASAVRTPIGLFQGSLTPVPATRLGAIAVRAAVVQAGEFFAFSVTVLLKRIKCTLWSCWGTTTERIEVLSGVETLGAQDIFHMGIPRPDSPSTAYGDKKASMRLSPNLASCLRIFRPMQSPKIKSFRPYIYRPTYGLLISKWKLWMQPLRGAA